MNSEAERDKTIYAVVVNDEEQYSIWPESRELPPGWRRVGHVGPKDECLAYIESVWKDMRPKSLRRQMEALRDSQAEPEAAGEGEEGPSVVESLSAGRHPIEAALHGEKTAARLKEYIDRRLAPIRFLDTRGPTELVIKLDQAACAIGAADFEQATGVIHLEGRLTLDRVSVRCVVDLDVATLRGEGFLVKLVD